MTNAQRMSLVTTLFNGIFAGKRSLTNEQWTHLHMPQGFEQFIVNWNPRTFSDGKLRGMDVDISTNGKVLNLRFLEQNPNKVDTKFNLKPMAILARQGHSIMWVIDRKQEVGGFLGRMQDGEWIPAKDTAYKPIQRNARTAMASQTEAMTSNVPYIPAGVSNPEYVVQSFTDNNPAESFQNYDYYEDDYYENTEGLDESY